MRPGSKPPESETVARVGDRRFPVITVITVPAGECPPVARNAHRSIEQVLAHPELRVRILGVDGRDRCMVADRSDVVIGQREGAGGLVGLDTELHPARGGALGARDGGSAKPHSHRWVRDVPLPPAPRDAPSAFEQKAVSRRDLAGRHEVERRHAKRAHRDPVAAVRHVEQQRAIRARGIGRDEKGRVAAEAHLPILAALRAIETDDARVGRMRGVHRVVRDGVDSLVRSGISERPAFIERLAPHDLQSCQSHVGPPSSVLLRPASGEVQARIRLTLIGVQAYFCNTLKISTGVVR